MMMYHFVDDVVPIMSIENPSHVPASLQISQMSYQFSSILKHEYCLNVPQDYLDASYVTS